MKKFIPFVFPLIAICLVLFLAMRWYNSKTSREGTQAKIAQFDDTTQIDNLSASDSSRLKHPAQDEKSVDLSGAGDAKGQVRYDVTNGKVYMTLTASLPDAGKSIYQVWFKDVNGESKKKAFTLVNAKGGYVGSAAVSADMLPFEVVVSKQKTADDAAMGATVLSGVIQKDSNSPS